MEWYVQEVASLAQKLRQHPLPPAPVAFYGSSSIRLWDRLPQDLDTPHVLNLGFGGSTLAACVHFFDQLIPLAQPGSLLVYAGDNDLGDGQSPEFVVDRFRALAEKILRFNPTLPWAFLSIKLSPSRLSLRPQIDRANNAIRLETSRHPNASFIDVASPLLNPAGYPASEYFQPDGLHLSPAGYRRWAETLKQDRNRMLIEPSPEIRGNEVSSSQNVAGQDASGIPQVV
jgi:lysophospholipase L1-like esterase